MLKRILPVCAVAAALWSVSAVSEEEKPFVADRHKEQGLTCIACHKEAKPKTAASAEACLVCHQSIEAVAEQKLDLNPNPHRNHVTEAMDLECTQCHHGHKADTPICHQCHTGMAFEKKDDEAK